MPIKLSNIIPKYFRDKLEEKDIKQVNALPEDLVVRFVNGSNADARKAMGEVRTREGFQGPILDDAAKALLDDYRSMVQENNPQGGGEKKRG